MQAAKIRLAALILLAAPFLLHGNSAGPNPGNTGADFESSCASCHGGPSGQGNVSIAFPTGLFYTPGAKQHLTVTIVDTAQKRWGFQATARAAIDSLSQAGQFTTGSDGFTQLSCLDKTYQLETFNNACINNTRLPLQYIEQTLAGSRGGTRGPVTFEFDWTPPAANVGNVDVYVVANAANDDGKTSGDHIYTAQYTLAPGPPGPPAVTSLVNGASFLPGIAPGAWVTVQGSNLSTASRSWAAADFIDGALPTQLDSVSVTIAGRPAYVSYIGPTQINAVAPPDIPPGAVDVRVTTALGTSAAITAQAQVTAPSFFLWSGKYPVATRPDYSLAAANGLFTGIVTVPAKPGEVIILWGTGFGITNPPAPPGRQLSQDTLYSAALAPSVTIGNLPAPVLGAALASGSVGLYQIAVRIPDAAPNGDLAITAEVAGQQSPTGVFLNVHK